MKNMKLCICMWYDDAIACYADRISKVNKAYCDKHVNTDTGRTSLHTSSTDTDGNRRL